MNAHLCCAKGCTRPSVDILFSTENPGVGYPICAEHKDKREWEILLKGNSFLEVDRDKVLIKKR